MHRAGNHLLQRDREDRRTSDKKKTDAGEQDSTDGGKNIEKPEAERSYFDKTTHFDKMLRMGAWLGDYYDRKDEYI